MEECLTPADLAAMTMLDAAEYGYMPVSAYNAIMRLGITTIGGIVDAVHTRGIPTRS